MSEPGCWECLVDHAWVTYAWPASSILEQGFCLLRSSVEFSARGHQYRVDFKEPLEFGGHAAVQVNTSTSVRRHVRRWPSPQHRDCAFRWQRERREAPWAAWLRADFTWSLLDPQEFASVGGGAQAPCGEAPPRRPYSLGGGASFSDAFWPQLLRMWPTGSLTAAKHPLGSRCCFALQCLSASTVPAAHGPEWQEVCRVWQQGGLGDSELVGAYRIQNRSLMHSFVALRGAMAARLSGEDFDDGVGREGKLQARLLWHGSRSVPGLLGICSDGFDRAQAVTCLYGKGCYFAASAAYSDKYACAVQIVGAPHRNLRAMLLAAVLVGESVQGSSGMYPPPVKPHSRNGERYDNTCDNADRPSIFVTFSDNQALPLYVVVYEPKR